jgi:hypothetical protein
MIKVVEPRATNGRYYRAPLIFFDFYRIRDCQVELVGNNHSPFGLGVEAVQPRVANFLSKNVDILTAWVPGQCRPRGVLDRAKLLLNILSAWEIVDIPNEELLDIAGVNGGTKFVSAPFKCFWEFIKVSGKEPRDSCVEIGSLVCRTLPSFCQIYNIVR